MRFETWVSFNGNWDSWILGMLLDWLYVLTGCAGLRRRERSTEQETEDYRRAKGHSACFALPVRSDQCNCYSRPADTRRIFFYGHMQWLCKEVGWARTLHGDSSSRSHAGQYWSRLNPNGSLIVQGFAPNQPLGELTLLDHWILSSW